MTAAVEARRRAIIKFQFANVMARVTTETTGSPNASMQFDHIARACRLMQTIDVLRNQSEIVKTILPACDRFMRRIRFQTCQYSPAVIEPFPNFRQIALDHSRRGAHAERHTLPNRGVAAAAKRRHTGFSGDSGAGQNHDVVRFAETLSKFVRD